MVQINVITNLITRETASEWPDDGVWTCSMGNLTRISWETSLSLVCGQLFAPQSNTLCGCTRIWSNSARMEASIEISCNVISVCFNSCSQIYSACVVSERGQRSGSAILFCSWEFWFIALESWIFASSRHLTLELLATLSTHITTTVTWLKSTRHWYSRVKSMISYSTVLSFTVKWCTDIELHWSKFAFLL